MMAGCLRFLVERLDDEITRISWLKQTKVEPVNLEPIAKNKVIVDTD
jgi:hypothetical protein